MKQVTKHVDLTDLESCREFLNGLCVHGDRITEYTVEEHGVPRVIQLSSASDGDIMKLARHMAHEIAENGNGVFVPKGTVVCDSEPGLLH